MDFNFNLEAFIASISSVIAVVGALFTSLVKLKKTIKQKIAATTENKITSLLQTLTTEAEAFKNFTGAEKKAIVLSQVRTFAVDNKLKYDEAQVTNWLEKIIQTTKTVNAKIVNAKTEVVAPVIENSAISKVTYFQ